MEDHKCLTKLLYSDLIHRGFYRTLDNVTVMKNNETVITIIYNVMKDNDGYYMYLNGYMKSKNISVNITKSQSPFTLRVYNGNNSLNNYNRIIIDRHRNWYYNDMKKIPIHDIQVKLDYHVINHLYKVATDVFAGNHQNMKTLYTQYYNELKGYQKQQYETTCQIIREFNRELKYMLIVLQSLLINKKCNINKTLFIRYIFPYIMMI